MRSVHTLINSTDIQTKINELAQNIKKDYQDKNVLLIGILKGSFIFLSDLSKALWSVGLHDFEIDFMGISSYGADTETSRNPRITKDLDTDIQNRHLLIVEDIVDTGHSLDVLRRILLERAPTSLKTVVLLAKESRREVDVPVEYIGFKVDGWVEGYGLDTNELFRGRSEIVEVKENGSNA